MEDYPLDTIVLEGLGGVGKTTAAENLAIQYGYSNLNTGSLFRATAATMLLESIALPELADFVSEANYDLSIDDPLHPHIAVNGRDVSGTLQTPKVTRLASHIGSQQEVANIIEETFNAALTGKKLVVEGKNIGDRVETAPDHRFFLVATQQVRAHRKHRQAQLKGDANYSLQMAKQDIVVNDFRDGHLLRIEAGTHIIDTSLLTPSQVVRAIIRHRDQSNRVL